MSAKRILIIDDESDIRHGVERWLKFAGYETLLAEDGEAGLESAQSHLPDAILMDVQMPRKDGMQALAELKEATSTSSIPVVMLSASLRDEQKALDAGAMFFVPKPFAGKTLVSTVKATLERKTTEICP
jgi:DNA-binding response OmpR family regulator